MTDILLIHQKLKVYKTYFDKLELSFEIEKSREI